MAKILQLDLSVEQKEEVSWVFKAAPDGLTCEDMAFDHIYLYTTCFAKEYRKVYFCTKEWKDEATHTCTDWSFEEQFDDSNRPEEEKIRMDYFRCEGGEKLFIFYSENSQNE